MNCTETLALRLTEQAKLSPNAKTLLWLDENISVNELSMQNLCSMPEVISNRIDDIEMLAQLGAKAEFSDFDGSVSTQKFDFIFYRISKERAVSHRCINQSLNLLTDQGILILIGRKEDGIKTYVSNCKKKLGAQGEIKKNKNVYTAHLYFPDKDGQLDDQSYDTLRKVADVDMNDQRYALYSKPGVYGWKKIDEGSQFLIDCIASQIAPASLAKSSALDLGCGSGHLSLALHALGARSITATDNNAAAIRATAKTLSSAAINASVLASNAGDTISEKFDLIVCNPPFHKGFDNSVALSENFVKACSRLLKIEGAAYFVTNAFIGIESLLQHAGMVYKQIANNKKFKVIRITHG